LKVCIAILRSLLLIIPFGLSGTPVADFQMNKSSGCSPLLVTFSNSSSGNNPTYYWEFGNGNTSTLKDPSASFINPGSYTVKLTVTDNTGSNSVSKMVTVFANPKADFTSDVPGACIGDPVCFFNRSIDGSGAINTWSWDFGDGKRATSQSPCTTYSFSDSFTIKLVVTDVNGCQSSLIKNYMIKIRPAHTVDFTSNVQTACRPPLTVNFKDTVKPASTYLYNWNFGDGGTSNQKNPAHTYTKRGMYTVELRVTHTTGCSRKITKPNYIKIHDPKANFMAPVTKGCAPFSVLFQNLSVAADSNALQYFWSTSNGLKSSLRTPEFTFKNPGKYSIQLIIVAANGCSDTIEFKDYIEVVDKPKLSFTIDERNFCTIPATINIKSTSSNVSKVTWFFSDGSTSNQFNPSKTFTKYGNYSIRVKFESADGCIDSIVLPDAIKIRQVGIVLNASPRAGCIPQTVIFDVIDTGVVKMTKYLWFLDGVKVAEDSIQLIKLFTKEGKYKMKVYAYTPEGCGDTSEVEITLGRNDYTTTISSDDTLFCFSSSGTVFNIKNLPNPDSVTWYIDYGDGKTGKELKHKYTSPGNYKVELYIINNGCITRIKMSGFIHVIGPQVSFDINAPLCLRDTVFFINKSEYTNNRFLWTFGDGDSAKTFHAKHRYKDSGNYVIRLIGENLLYNCRDTFTTTLWRPGEIKPGFILTHSTGCAPLTIQFKDTSILSGTLKTRVWESNGFNIAGANDSTLLINKKGFSYLRLKLTDQYGCDFFLTKDSSIHVYDGATDFKITPDKGCIPFTTTLTSNSTIENPISSYKWIWGDGKTEVSDSSFTTHTYNTVPKNQNYGFTIIQLVTDTAGCVFSASKNIMPAKPIPQFTNQLIKFCGKDSFIFTPTLDISSGIGPFKYYWVSGNINRGGNAFNQSFSLGDTTLPLKMIVTDALGCKDSVTNYFHSDTRKPVAGFYANPQKINCPGPPVFFFDTSLAGATKITSLEWNLGDGSRSALKSPAITYLLPGIYDISLKVMDSIGCVDSIFKKGYILISGPTAKYSYTPKNGCMPLQVEFTAISKNTKKYEWDLGDGYIDTNAVLKHWYTRANVRGGSYKPNLTITDSAGCKIGLLDPDSIVVYPLPKPDFSTDQKLICVQTGLVIRERTTHDIPLVLNQWSFGDGDRFKDTIPFSYPVYHSYTSQGLFDISLKVTDILNCSDSIIKREVVQVIKDTVPPAVPILNRVTVLNNTETELNFLQNTETDFNFYTVEYDFISHTPTSFKDNTHAWDTVFTNSGLNTLHQIYAYRVSATDLCGNVSSPSPIHQTIELTATGDTNAIQLNWNAYVGWDSVSTYQITRLNETTGIFENIDSVGGSTLSYIDTNVQCFKTYFYKIIAQKYDADIYSSSDTSGAVPIYKSLTPGTRNIRATVVNNSKILIQWERRTYKLPFTIVIYKSTDSSESKFYKELSALDTSFIDEDVKVGAHYYTYTTYLKDACGGYGPESNIARSILLKGDLKANDIIEYDPYLFWSAYNKWFNGVDHYKVQFQSDSAGHFMDVAKVMAGSTLDFTHTYMNSEQYDYCYKVVAFKKDSQEVFSESNIVCLPTKPRLYAPNAFTINNDGLNEKFKLGGIFLNTFHLQIFDRYGKKVFESYDLKEGWDGTNAGLPCASDVYVFIAEGTGRMGQVIELHGNVTLLR